ncbi:MAG: Flp pilus assembly complex ATPase component TadA [Myxococcales bacterium]|nr:Flp pilus assembly complex ATPase component TadA [Myxococcales bacterium]
MWSILIADKDGSQRRIAIRTTELMIGRLRENHVVLDAGNVSKRHAKIVLRDESPLLWDLHSTNGTYINGKRVNAPWVVRPGDKIYIGDYVLQLADDTYALPAGPVDGADNRMPSATPWNTEAPGSRFAADERLDEAAHLGLGTNRSSDHTVPAEDGFTEATTSYAGGAPPAEPPALDAAQARVFEAGDRDTTHPFVRVMAALAMGFDVFRADAAAQRDPDRRREARQRAMAAVRYVLAQGDLPDSVRPDDLVALAVEEAVGLGALAPLLMEEDTRRVTIQGPWAIVRDRGDGGAPVPAMFSSNAALMTVARRLVSRTGGALSPEEPICEVLWDADLHVTIVQPPVAARGTIVDVRRLEPAEGLDALSASEALDDAAVAGLREALSAHQTLAVLGTSGPAVRRALAALCLELPETERVVAVEATAGLALEQPTAISLTCGPPSLGISVPDLVCQAVRFDPDRIVIDGMNGAELFDILTLLDGRAGGDIIGVRLRSGDAPKDALIAACALRGQAPRDEIAALVERTIGLIAIVGEGEDGALLIDVQRP